jgi:phosphoglycolate phosphatase
VLILYKLCFIYCFGIYFYIAIATELKKVGISYCGVGPDIAEQNMSYTDFEKDPEVGAVIVGFDEHFSYPKMVKATIYLKDTNVHFIGTNMDERLPISKNVIIPGT